MLPVRFNFAGPWPWPIREERDARANQLCRCGGAEGEAQAFQEGRMWGNVLTADETWRRYNRRTVEKERVMARGPE